eukprot:gene3304-3624_t
MATRCFVLGKQTQVIDLSYPLNDHTIFWPGGGEGFKLCLNCSRSEAYGYDYAAGTICTAEHGGTHVDAPFHFHAKGKHVDEILLQDLIGPAKVIDISTQCATDDNYTLSAADIQMFENLYGVLGKGDIVLIRTGWHRKYVQGANVYLGYEGDYSEDTVLSFPGIGADAASLFVDRGITAVGLDTASLDKGCCQSFIAHQILLQNDIYGIENINEGIDLLPPVGATLMVWPIKVTGGSGAPARVSAFIE